MKWLIENELDLGAGVLILWLISLSLFSINIALIADSQS